MKEKREWWKMLTKKKISERKYNERKKETEEGENKWTKIVIGSKGGIKKGKIL